MKARAPAPLFDQALTPMVTSRTPPPQPLSPEERGEPIAPRTPSPSGRRGPEGPDEGLAAIGGLDWPSIGRDLDAYGCAIAPKLMSRATCRELATLYPDDAHFRSHVVVADHGFGRGE